MKTFALFMLLFFSFHLNAQTLNDYYDLKFQDFNECNWDWMHYKNACRITLDKKEEEKAPSLKIAYRSIVRVSMEFALYKNIISREFNNQNFEVSLTAKNSSDSVLQFTVTGVDSNETITFQGSNIIKKTAKWKKATISVASKNISAINIYIQYKGNASQQQLVELQSISIKKGRKDIGLTTSAGIQEPGVTLEPEHILPLEINDSSGTQLMGIKEIRESKIIGLGENTHGSETIANAQILFAKNIITHHNCALVLLEIPYDVATLYDLYAQGLIPNLPLEYLKCGFDYYSMAGFLKWLRTYNVTAEKKVHIFGIDNPGKGAPPIPLMDYLLELLGKEKAEPYLKKLYKGERNVIEMIAKDSSLKVLLGTKNHSYYLNALSGCIGEKTNWTRDEGMFKRLCFLDSLFLGPGEKAVVLAHSGHLQKNKVASNNYYYMLGSFLNEHYNKNYCAINFTFGSGIFTQDSCSFAFKVIEDSLKFIPNNSFEYAALKTKYDFFYYPAQFLGSNIVTTAFISRTSQNKNHFKFAALRKRFDGYVFLRKSENFKQVEKSIFSYNNVLYSEKRKKYQLLIDSYNAKSNLPQGTPAPIQVKESDQE